MIHKIKIGVIGDYHPEYVSHIATDNAVIRTGRALGISVDVQWISTPVPAEQTESLEPLDGVWCAPGSPYQSLEGALTAIRFAREKGYPFIGT